MLKKALPKNRPTPKSVAPSKPTPKKAVPPKRVPHTVSPPVTEVKTPQELPKQVAAPTTPIPTPTPTVTAPITPITSTPLEQYSYAQLKELTHPERVKMWEQLNKGKSNDFIQIIRKDHLPKQLVLRLLEAKARAHIGTKPPGKDVYYCPYCVSYMKFQYHPYTGYHKCIGCSISTRDFYVSADNQLFNVN